MSITIEGKNYRENPGLLKQVIECRYNHQRISFRNCDFSKLSLDKGGVFPDRSSFWACNFNDSAIDLKTFPNRYYLTNGCTWHRLTFIGYKATYNVPTNSTLIADIADKVINENSPFSQQDWHTDKHNKAITISNPNVHDCNTAHCIGGWAEMLAPGGAELVRNETHRGAGIILLGLEVASYFYANDAEALQYLSWVISKQKSPPPVRCRVL